MLVSLKLFMCVDERRLPRAWHSMKLLFLLLLLPFPVHHCPRHPQIDPPMNQVLRPW